MLSRFAGSSALSIVLIFASSFATAQTPDAPGQLTLRDAFHSALEKNESSRLQDSRIEQAQERVKQARGGVIPHLAFNWSYLRQDVPPGSTNAALARTSAGFLQPDQTTTKFTLTQPLFQGFREFAGISQLNYSLAAARDTKCATIVELFKSVAQSYFELIAAEKDLVDIRGLIEISQNQIKELQSFTRLGRSRRSDLLTSQAQLANLQAQAIAAETATQKARQQFALITGLSPDVIVSDWQFEPPSNLATLESMLTSIEERPDIRSLRSLVEAAEQNVRYQRGGYWPHLDLTGNYYLNRTGYLEGSKWDVGLALTFPLFKGGTNVSQVRQAQAQLTEANLNLEYARRSAQGEISSAYKIATTGIDQVSMIKRSLELIEQAYKEQVRDYRRGANTNLDVLSALNSLADTRRNLDRTCYQTQLAIINLQTSQGRIPREFE